jgi:hypothetical protein
MLNKCSVELYNALPHIWAHIYNDLCLMTVLAWENLHIKMKLVCGLSKIELPWSELG